MERYFDGQYFGFVITAIFNSLAFNHFSGSQFKLHIRK